jgi:hypothetical protein
LKVSTPRRALPLAFLILAQCAPRLSPPIDRSFCAISQQSGKRAPTLSEIETIRGRYRVSLYSADSGATLDKFGIALTPTDSITRFNQKIYDSNGSFQVRPRKQQLLATGRLTWSNGGRVQPDEEYPPISLLFGGTSWLSIFVIEHAGNALSMPQTGLNLLIRQVIDGNFSGTVDAIGTVTAEHDQKAGRWRNLGPYFFCAVHEARL